MSQIAYRDVATHCVDRAANLLNDYSEHQTRYACLELRLAIEALVYDLFQTYASEVSAAAMAAWTPKQIMRELKYIDPEVDRSHSVTIGIPGKPGRPETVHDLNEHRFSAQWADKAHNALGSFLHQPTLRRWASDRTDARHDRVQAKAHEVLRELRKVLNSSIRNVRASKLAKIKCEACGTLIARDESFLNAGKDIICSSCGTHYSYWLSDDKKVFNFSVKLTSWICFHCQTENILPFHCLRENTDILCRNCGDNFVVKQIYILVPKR